MKSDYDPLYLKDEAGNVVTVSKAITAKEKNDYKKRTKIDTKIPINVPCIYYRKAEWRDTKFATSKEDANFQEFIESFDERLKLQPIGEENLS